MFYKALRRCSIQSGDGKDFRLKKGDVIEAPANAFKHIGKDVLEASKDDPRKAGDASATAEEDDD